MGNRRDELPCGGLIETDNDDENNDDDDGDGDEDGDDYSVVPSPVAFHKYSYVF